MRYNDRIKFNKEAQKLLFKVFAQTKDQNKVEMILRDILSSKEINEIARRLLAVKRLYSGSTYQQINTESKMGMTTINKMHFKTRGSKILRNILS